MNCFQQQCGKRQRYTIANSFEILWSGASTPTSPFMQAHIHSWLNSSNRFQDILHLHADHIVLHFFSFFCTFILFCSFIFFCFTFAASISFYLFVTRLLLHSFWMCLLQAVQFMMSSWKISTDNFKPIQ